MVYQQWDVPSIYRGGARRGRPRAGEEETTPVASPEAAPVAPSQEEVTSPSIIIEALTSETILTSLPEVSSELFFPPATTNSTIETLPFSSSTPHSVHLINGTSCTDYDSDLFWIKVGLFSAAGVCLIMLACMSCILALVYCAYYKLKDGESSIELRSNKKQQSLEDSGFKRLTVNRQDGADLQRRQQQQQQQQQRAPFGPVSPQAGSPGPGVSTFSAHMAPPVPKSGAHLTPVGASPAEETPIRKGALDRIEQEEAKRHNDMLLMADKQSNNNRQTPGRSSGSKQQKSKSRSKSNQAKNPTFVVDKNTLKLVRVDGRGSKDVTGNPQGGGKGTAVEIPFKF